MLKRVISMALIGAFLASSGTIVSNVTGNINNPCVNESYDTQFDFEGGFDAANELSWLSRNEVAYDENGNSYAQGYNSLLKYTFAYGGTEIVKQEVIIEKSAYNIVYLDGYVYFSCSGDEGGTDVMKVNCSDITELSTVFHCDGDIENMYLGEQAGKQYILYNCKGENTIFAYDIEANKTSEYELEHDKHYLCFLPTDGGIITFFVEDGTYTFLNRNASVITVTGALNYVVDKENGIVVFTFMNNDFEYKQFYATFEELSNPSDDFELIEIVEKPEEPKPSNIKAEYDEQTKTLTISGEGRLRAIYDVEKYHAYVENLIINEGITEIAPRTFEQNTRLKTVSLPSSLKKIDEFAFVYCPRIVTVNMSEGLEEIGYGAFWKCEDLTDMQIPSTVRKIGGFAFEGTSWYKNQYADDGFVIVGDNVLIKYTGDDENVVIPYGVKCVTNIFDEFDLWTTQLEHKRVRSVEFPDTVKYMYGACFGYDLKIDKVEIPYGVEELGSHTFGGEIGEIIIPESVKMVSRHTVCSSKSQYILFKGERPEVYSKLILSDEEDNGYLDSEKHREIIINFNSNYESSWLSDNGEYYWKEMECKIKPINIFAKSTIKGDADGDGYITSADATKILRVVANLEYFNSDELERACVTGDSLSAADATRILRVVAGLDSIE